MTSVSAGGVPFGTQIHLVAEEDPEGIGVIFAAEDGTDRQVRWRELDERSTQMAHVLVERGLRVGDHLAVCLRNSPEHLMVSFAGWKVGATVVPMRWDLPEWERGRVLAAIRPKVTIDAGSAEFFETSLSAPTTLLDEVVPPRGWGICSSGSTGTPKVIERDTEGLFFAAAGGNSVVEAYGAMPAPQLILVPAPLYHSNGFTATRNLMAGECIVLLERFNAERILDLVERYRVTGFIAATPMLQRLAQVPDVERRDLSSLGWVQQGASPLPVWLGRRWCELIGPEHFFLSYGASEGHGLACCRGDEWLAHPGTLGRPLMGTEIKILDEDGTELPTGEIGGIYMRSPLGAGVTYIGENVTQLAPTPDGFVTVGDMGWVDEEGWLYMADRRVDMIVTGAANVYPAEVESALSEHPQVRDVVVIGLRDPEWGRRVHAIVEPVDVTHPPDPADIIAFAKERLSPYKVPKTVEFLDALPRSDAMKLNRGALVLERDGPEPAEDSPDRAAV